MLLLRHCTSAWIVPRDRLIQTVVRRVSHRIHDVADGQGHQRWTSTDAASHIKRYHLTGHTSEHSPSGVTVRTTSTNHTIATDLPQRMGGNDTAPQPVEWLLTAWIGCTQATALFVARHLPNRVRLERMEFDVTAERDERGALHLPITDHAAVPSRLQRIQGTVKVYTKERIGTEQLTLLQEQTERRCPVANMMVASGCVMDIDWIELNETE